MVVEFVIEPNGFIEAAEYPLALTVRELRDAIASDLGVPAPHIVIRFHGIFAHPDRSLADCGLVGGEGRLETGHIVIDSSQTGDEYRMPDLLIVAVRDDRSGEVQAELLVAIERATEGKPYMGGFRHRLSGVEYHHAATQTPTLRKKPWEGRAPKLSRDTQTVEVITRSAQTLREASTQMERKDLFLDTRRDKVGVPGAYVTADELDALKAENIVVVQRCWRGFVARRRARALRASREADVAAREAEAEARAREAAERHRAEVERRMHPRTKKDFEVLYNEVEAWRAAETRRIGEEAVSETDKAEQLAEVLAKQTKMLQTIEKLKATAARENRAVRVDRVLSSMASPKKWEGSDGEVAEVHTPFTTRALELKNLYDALATAGLPVQDRLDVLLHVKWTVKEFDCGLTREIVELLDRESDLLQRGRPEKGLSGLRQRLLNLFLQFIETPEFNPEATRFLRVHRDLTTRPNVVPIAR